MLNHRSVLDIVEIVSQERTRKLDLKRLSSVAGWSQFYLQRIFSRMVGESPRRFQERLRLEEAAVRLSDTGQSILEIALATGYESHEVFTRAFQRRFGTTPSGYRRERLDGGGTGNALHAQFVRKVGPCIGLYHVRTEHRDRRIEMPTSQIERRELVSTPILFIQRRVPHSGFQELFAECFPRIYGHCMKHGYAMAGNPIARYVEFTPGMATVDCVIPLQHEAESDGDIQAGELQSGLVAFATHTGPYETLNETYSAIESWMEQQGCERNGPNWEWYITDPGDVPDPEEWKTEVFFPIR